ncbi:hypothetical protein [Frankia sp. CiP1_Cm_nod2]|uniref:hypothetical protein n=1 Tax=Frankia sp. CiP1_Cm_nod2 TaxID=2897161 RepID=UPI002023EC22
MVRRILLAVTVVLVAAFCVGVLFGLPLLHRIRDDRNAASPTAADPFAGTPAASFAAGADGLVLPAAADTGSFTAAEVETALQQAKKLLVAAYLDPRVFGGDLGPVYATMNNGLRQSIQETAADPSKNDEILFPAARFAPGVTLAAPDARAKGSITYAPGEKPGTLVVTANHVYVYPLRRDSFRALLTVHRDLDITFYRPGTAPAGRDGISGIGGRGALYWDFDCEAMKKGLLAPGRPLGYADTEPGQPAYHERFDPATAIVGKDICGPG